jgi:phosphatidylserine/phosphatidylglycerophosphate/cardiolipin synthase-like enzyme
VEICANQFHPLNLCTITPTSQPKVLKIKILFILALLAARTLSAQDKIQVYFNQGINTNVGLANNFAAGTTGNQCADATLNMLNQAKYTIDVAMYNTNYTAFVNALKAAKARGVRVRMIADADQSNSALNSTVNFPLFFGSAGQDGIMHNKFVIVDANSATATDAWISSGSTNWTTYQVLTDPNNLILIQNQAMAKAFTTEFEEMWGSTGDQYNSTNAKFGMRKTNNTPHIFDVGGTQVEVWFSPSDQMNTQITRVIQSANATLDFSLLILTMNDLTDRMVTKHQQGVRVRGAIDDDIDLAQPYYTLKNANVPVYLHKPATILHHKYAIVDVDEASSDPLVLTGSHNWTYSAQTINDENTLIIHSQKIADLYRKEFERRYLELNPTEVTNLPEIVTAVYPNPVTDILYFDGLDAEIDYEMYHISGALAASGQVFRTIPVDNIPAGLYQLVLKHTDGRRQCIPIFRN